jgi:hypothetical protein
MRQRYRIRQLFRQASVSEMITTRRIQGNFGGLASGAPAAFPRMSGAAYVPNGHARSLTGRNESRTHAASQGGGPCPIRTSCCAWPWCDPDDPVGMERWKASLPATEHGRRAIGAFMSLEQQILNIPQRQRGAHIQHHDHPDHLGRRVKASKRAGWLGSRSAAHPSGLEGRHLPCHIGLTEPPSAHRYCPSW